jgi:hypothetical protein
MILTEKEKLYVDLKLSSVSTDQDFSIKFTQEELIDFRDNKELQNFIVDEKLKKEIEEIDLKRRKIAKQILDLENLDKIMPLAYQCIVNILKDPNNKNAAPVIKALISGKIRFLEKFAENQANSDLPNESSKAIGFEPFNKSKRAYDPDDWE